MPGPFVNAAKKAAQKFPAATKSLLNLYPRNNSDLRRILQFCRARTTASHQYSKTPNKHYPKKVEVDVSVIIPLYNYEKYIIETLNSITPSHLRIEIIVVNDKSTDSSLEVAKAWILKSPIPGVLLDAPRNTGLARSRNIGLEYSKGKYTFMLDADDILYPNALQDLFELAEKSKASATYGTVHLVDDNLKPLHLTTSDKDADFEDLKRKNYISAAALFHTHTLCSIGGYDEDLLLHGVGSEDWELWIRLSSKSMRISRHPSPVIMYRQKQGSMISATTMPENRRAITSYMSQKFQARIG